MCIRDSAGSVEDSRAVLRRWVSLCSRALIRDFISATTFSSSSAACAFSVRLVEVRMAVSSVSYTHLDVYKRQDYCTFECPLRGSGGGRRQPRASSTAGVSHVVSAPRSPAERPYTR